MEIKKYVSSWFIVYLNEKEVLLFFMEAGGLINLFVFETEVEAEDFYRFCVEVAELTAGVSRVRQLLACQVLLKEGRKRTKQESWSIHIDEELGQLS